MSEQPDESKPEFPRSFLRLFVVSQYLWIGWMVAAVVASVTQINRGRPRAVYLASLVTAGLGMAAFLVTATIVTIWLHRLTGEWPWSGWTPRSALRSWWSGPERFGSKPRHKVELAILGVLALMLGLIALGAALSE